MTRLTSGSKERSDETNISLVKCFHLHFPQKSKMC